jgi:hypothetical protein
MRSVRRKAEKRQATQNTELPIELSKQFPNPFDDYTLTAL